MKILIISTSMRANSQSLKVSKYLESRVRLIGEESSVLDLHELRLPLYDDGETSAENKSILIEKLDEADGYVFVSPEWNGMMSHGLVNMMHYVKHEMANKPVMLVGVGSGSGGTYPLAQMRLMGYKNNHFIISPESLIVNNVKFVMNDFDLDESAPDYRVKSRAEYSLKVLIEYSKALVTVRKSGVVDQNQFKNGV